MHMFTWQRSTGLQKVLVLLLLSVSFAAPGFVYADFELPPPLPGPTLTSVAIASNNSAPALATVGNTVTITFTASEAIDTPSATILGNTATIANAGGDTYTASYTLLASDAEGIVAFTIDFNASGGGFAGTQVTDVTDGSSVTLDKTARVIATHADITAEAASTTGATVSYTDPTAEDGSVVSCSPASGTIFALGMTTVTCNASDAAGNAATPTTFIVSVVDTTAPVITLTGASSQTLTVGDSFTDEGATASDAVTASVSVSVSGSVNTSSAGTYVLTYSATDNAGNAAAEVTRTVTVNAAPSNARVEGGGGSGGSLYPVAPVLGTPTPPAAASAPAPASPQGSVLGAQTTITETPIAGQTAPAEVAAPRAQVPAAQGSGGAAVAQAQTSQAPAAETPETAAPDVEPQENTETQAAASGLPAFNWWWLLLLILLALGAGYWTWRKYKEYKERKEPGL